MSTFKKLLGLLVALIATCAGTYVWVARQCKAEATILEKQVEAASTRSRELSGELQEARRELEDLKVWRHLGELQQRLAEIHRQVDALNFGLALDQVAGVAASLEKGELGERFRQQREELLPFLDRCADALKKKDDSAHETLSRLERRAFELLSGLTPGGAAEGESGAEGASQKVEAEAVAAPTPESGSPPAES